MHMPPHILYKRSHGPHLKSSAIEGPSGTTLTGGRLCSSLHSDDGGTFPVSVAAASTCALCRMCAHSTS